MKKEKYSIVRFFLAHLAIAIPVLLTSILITLYISHEMIKVEEKIVEQQMNMAADMLMQEYMEMTDRGILLAVQPELRKKRMTQDNYETIPGIELLELQTSFDQNIVDIFVTYSSGKVYASTGVSTYQNYFRHVKNMNEKSIEMGLAALERKENSVSFLETDTNQKYILYSIGADIKVNFLVYVQELSKLFQTQYGGRYFELIAEDGTTL